MFHYHHGVAAVVVAEAKAERKQLPCYWLAGITLCGSARSIYRGRAVHEHQIFLHAHTQNRQQADRGEMFAEFGVYCIRMVDLFFCFFFWVSLGLDLQWLWLSFGLVSRELNKSHYSAIPNNKRTKQNCVCAENMHLSMRTFAWKCFCVSFWYPCMILVWNCFVSLCECLCVCVLEG